MSDIADLRDLLSKEFPEQRPEKDKCNNNPLLILTIIALLALGLVKTAISALPMPADDYHRLNAAITGLANAKQKDANLYWQKIYFKLSINDISELKIRHTDAIEFMITKELADTS